MARVCQHEHQLRTVAKGVFAESHLCSRLGPAWATDSSHITEQALLHTWVKRVFLKAFLLITVLISYCHLWRGKTLPWPMS